MIEEAAIWSRNTEMAQAAAARYANLVEEANTETQRRRYGPAIAVQAYYDYGAYSSSNGGM